LGGEHNASQKGAGVAFQNAQRVVLNAIDLDQVAMINEPELMPLACFERVDAGRLVETLLS
jgi:hypothetical protein